MRFIAWFFLANSIIFIIIGSRYLYNILSSDTLFQTSLAHYTKFFVLSFTIINFCTYMILLAFMPALLVGLLIIICPNQRIIRSITVIIGSLSIIALLADSYIYALFKLHLNSTLLELTFSTDIRQVFDLSSLELIELCVLLFAIITIELSLSHNIWKFILKHTNFHGKIIFNLCLLSIIFCYITIVWSIYRYSNVLIQQIANLPFYHNLLTWALPNANTQRALLSLSEQHYAQTLFANKPLNYPKHALSCNVNTNNLPNIIFIMIDSLRADALNDMPYLQQFAQNNWQFMRHISGGNSTQSGLFAIFYSIPSSYWTAALTQHKRPILMDILSQEHYSMKAIWSSEMHHPPMDRTIFLRIDDINASGAPTNDLGNADRYTTKSTIHFLNTSVTQTPFFLNIFYNAAHGHCKFQSFPAIYQPAAHNCSRLLLTKFTNPQKLYNSYRNAVHFIDAEIQQLLQNLKKNGYLKNSIVIITSDHGQEYNDNHQNYWGHSGNYTDVQTAVPLIIHWPNAVAHKFTHYTTSYDIVPTLLHRVFQCSNDMTDYSIGRDLLDKNRDPLFILAGSYTTMGIIEDKQITTFHASGTINVTDRHATPLNIKPNLHSIKHALKLMRQYFVL